MKDRTYTFYKDEQEFTTSNLMAFCREHGLQRRHMQEVVMGKRKSHHGFSLAGTGDEGMVSVESVLVQAEIAARSSGDPEYEKLVLSRTAKIRRGEPINIKQGKNEKGEDTITVLN